MIRLYLARTKPRPLMDLTAQANRHTMKNDKSKTQQISLGVGLLALAAWGQPVLAQDEPTHPTGSHQAVVDRQEIIDLNIPSSRLDHALLAFAKQTGAGVFIDGLQLSHQQSPRLQGRYTYDQALALLLDGSGFGFRLQDRDGALQVILIDLKQQANAPMEIGTVAVEGIATEERDNAWVYQQPRSVSVISREHIDKYPPRHIAEILQDTPGVNASMNYQTPGLAINIRGIQDYGRVAMMVDGARQNYQISGHQQRNGEAFIDPELISNVVIEKGPSAGLGSAGTIGGSANFRTIDIEDIIKPGEDKGLRFRGSTGVGKYRNGNKYNGSVVTAFKFDNKADLLAAYSRKRNGEFDAGKHGDYSGNSEDINKAMSSSTVEYSKQESESALIKGSILLNEAHRIRLSAMHSEFKFDTASTSIMETWNTQNKIETDTFSITHEWRPDSDWLAIDSKIYYVKTENNQDIPDRFPGYGPAVPHGFSSRTQTETYGITVQNKARFHISGFDANLNYGADLSKDRTSPKASGSEPTNTDYATALQGVTPRGERWLGSLFSSLRFDHGNWLSITTGLRYDRYKLEGGSTYTNPYTRTWTSPCATRPALAGCYVTGSEEFAEAENKEGRFSPNFGIAIKPFQPWQIYINWGKGWRPPAITETLIAGNHRYVNDGTSLYPNPNLEAERSETWEIGSNLNFENLLFKNDNFNAKLSYFNIHTENWIGMARVRLPNGPNILPLTTLAYINTTPVVSKGYEAELAYNVRNIYTKGSYTRNDMYSKSQYKTDYLGGVNYCDTYPCMNNGLWYYPKPPRDIYTLQIGARFIEQRLDIGLRQRYSSGHKQLLSSDGHYSNLENYEGTLKSYHVLDLYGTLKATEDLQINLSITNIRDRLYAIPMGDVQTMSPSPGRTITLGFEYRL